MRCPTEATLLVPGGHLTLMAALARYRAHYDEPFDEVHRRLAENGFATKLDLAALIGWKRVQTGRWMKDLLALAPGIVETKTATAFSPGLPDQARIDALAGIPGFQRGKAFTSVLLAAWDPSRFGVYDQIASRDNWPKVVTAVCACNRRSLPVYLDHLRQIAAEMTTSAGTAWTPRNVDMALLKL